MSKYITLRKFAAETGTSVQTLYKHRSKGRPYFVKPPGERVKVDVVAYEAWMKAAANEDLVSSPANARSGSRSCGAESDFEKLSAYRRQRRT